jgi:hypothetical protein
MVRPNGLRTCEAHVNNGYPCNTCLLLIFSTLVILLFMSNIGSVLKANLCHQEVVARSLGEHSWDLL